jgi:hypothetical protein
MRRLVTFVLVAAAAGTVIATPGCTDVGDSSAVPGLGGATLVDDDAGLGESGAEGAPSASEDAPAASENDDAPAAVGPDDSGAVDSAAPVAASEDAGGFDAGIFDATVPDDASLEDAGVADTGAPDATIADSGADAGTADAGFDAGPVLDSGTDAAGGALAPCTRAGQSNCVQCQYNNGASGTFPNADQVCTPTEAALVQHDIASGLATTAGADPNGSCYQCAALSGCLDDSEFADKGHECEDLAGSTSQAQCEATLTCILGSSCGSAALSACYCGTAPVSGSCAAVGSSNAASGACVAAEATGLGFTSNDGLDILKNFTSTTLPAGVANNIFQCATSNDCTTCLQ